MRSGGRLRERPVDRPDHPLDEPQEIAERPVLIGDVALEREVRAVELQQEARRNDRLVLDLERVGERCEIGLLAVVVGILHRRRDDAGRGRGHEGLEKTAFRLIERGAEIGTLGADRARIEIAHLAHRHRRLEVADRGTPFLLLLHPSHELGVAHDIAPRVPLPASAEAAHPALQVKKKPLALLLAIVADVDPRGDLLRHHPRQRRAACRLDLGGIDRLAGGAPHVQPHQLRRPRQAARMGGQDPLRAPPHRSCSAQSTSASRADQRHAGGAGRRGELPVERRERRLEPARKLEIGRVIDR